MTRPKLRWLEPTEKQIENGILSYLNRLGPKVVAMKINTVGIYDVQKKCHRRASQYVVRGCSDIILSVEGAIVCMECKSAKGVQSLEQKEFQRRIEASEGFYFIVRSIYDAQEALKDVYIILKVEPIKP